MDAVLPLIGVVIGGVMSAWGQAYLVGRAERQRLLEKRFEAYEALLSEALYFDYANDGDDPEGQRLADARLQRAAMRAELYGARSARAVVQVWREDRGARSARSLGNALLEVCTVEVERTFGEHSRRARKRASRRLLRHVEEREEQRRRERDGGG